MKVFLIAVGKPRNTALAAAITTFGMPVVIVTFIAMLELSKGKLTSAPDRHSGRGLFFTSRLADVFDLHANATAFQYRGWDRRRRLACRSVSSAWRTGRSAT